VTLPHADGSAQPGASIFRVNQSGFLLYSLTLKMEALRTAETMDSIYRRRRMVPRRHKLAALFNNICY